MTPFEPSRSIATSRRRASGATAALLVALCGLASLHSGPVQAQDTAPSRARYSFASVGLAPGQALRVTVFTPPPAGDVPPPTGDVPPPTNDRVRVLLLATSGDLLADTGDLALPPGPIRSFTVQRDRLGRAGEDGTGRLQLRVVVLVTGELPPGPIVPAVEVLAAGGRTVIMLPPPVNDRL